MIELIRTNDPVLLSWLAAHLEADGIGHVILDTHMSIMEGSVGILPRRVMVLAEDEAAARAVLALAPGEVETGRAATVGVDPRTPATVPDPA